jgi:hypothetical protein
VVQEEAIAVKLVMLEEIVTLLTQVLSLDLVAQADLEAEVLVAVLM